MKKSNCCNAIVSLRGRVTKFYTCTECGKACDTMKETNDGNEEEFLKFLVTLTEYREEGNKIAHLYPKKKAEWALRAQQSTEKLWQWILEHTRNKQIETLDEIMEESKNSFLRQKERGYAPSLSKITEDLVIRKRGELKEVS